MLDMSGRDGAPTKSRLGPNRALAGFARLINSRVVEAGFESNDVPRRTVPSYRFPFFAVAFMGVTLSGVSPSGGIAGPLTASALMPAPPFEDAS